MPLDLARILRVDKVATAKVGTFSYTVTAETVEDRPRTIQVQTPSDWKASVCEASIEAKCDVWIGSKDSRYGLDIVTVEIDDTKWKADES